MHWKIDDNKILTDTNKFADEVTWKNVVVWISCITKDDNKFYPLLLGKWLVAQK